MGRDGKWEKCGTELNRMQDDGRYRNGMGASMIPENGRWDRIQWVWTDLHVGRRF